MCGSVYLFVCVIVGTVCERKLVDFVCFGSHKTNKNDNEKIRRGSVDPAGSSGFGAGSDASLERAQTDAAGRLARYTLRCYDMSKYLLH